MRTRLYVVFLVPMTVILLVLGVAYGTSAAQGVQQQVTSQLLGDSSYFATGARQALRAGDPGMIESELRRYGSLYDAEVVVYDQSGTRWAQSSRSTLGSDTTAEQVRLALSGRRGEPRTDARPWAAGETEIVEPVFDDGTVIGAVHIVVDNAGPRRAIVAQWSTLLVVSAAVIGLLVWAVHRLATWVLKPLRRLDTAMAAIESGEMGARISDDTGPPEAQRMVRMFNQMADEIERVMTRQQEFVMNASHELRNPLGALLMRVEYLATGLDEGWLDDIEDAREEGRRMTRILDTLLHVARAGKADSPFTAIDLREVADERCAAWQDRAGERQVRLRASGAAPALCVAERVAVESALDAIIDNALKFAPPGSAVDVEVEVGSTQQTISVRDRGRGLDPDERAQATGRFWRSAQDQNVPGSGLGLAIASDLMEVLGGRVDLASPEGGGLRVSLVFPGAEPLVQGSEASNA